MEQEKFQGAIGRTRLGPITYSCECGTKFGTKVYLSVDVTEDRELDRKAREGTINASSCPRCGTQARIPVQYIYHDPARARFVLVLPPEMRHWEITARATLLGEIAESTENVIPDYVLSFPTVFGHAGLAALLDAPSKDERARDIEEKHRGLADELEKVRSTELLLREREQGLAQREEALMKREDKLRERGEKITEKEDELEELEEELSQKKSQMDDFSAHLRTWEARLLEQQQALDGFARLVEEKKRQKKEAAQEAPAAAAAPEAAREAAAPPAAAAPGEKGEAEDGGGKEPAEEEKPVSWFPAAPKVTSPTIASSIEKVLPAGRTTLEVQESDVVEEADLIDEFDIVEEKPIVPIPLKEPAAEKRSLPPEARKSLVSDEKVLKDLLSARRRSVALKDEKVQLWAVVPSGVQPSSFEPSWARLRCHRFLDERQFPWIILTLSVTPPGAEPLLRTWLFNFKEPEHYRVIRFLEKKFAAEISLVPDDLDRISSFSLSAPLEANLKKITAETEKALSEKPSLAPGKDVDEGKIVDALLAELGKPFPFGAKYFPDDAPTGAVRAALDDLAAWADPQMQEKIVAVFSFPLESMGRIKARVLRRAFEAGVFVPEPLQKEAMALAIVPSRREAVVRLVRAFTQTCREGGGGLTEDERRENWGRLLAEAKKFSLKLEPETAAAAIELLGEAALDEKTVADFHKFLQTSPLEASPEMLRRWLAFGQKRTTAALEILKRGLRTMLADVSASMKQMERGEIEKVLAAAAQTEDIGETILLEALRGGRREVVLAAAVHLGRLKLRSAIVPLIKIMLDAPAPDWKAVAWILTRFQVSAVRGIEQFVKDPRGQEEKIIYLLGALHRSGQEKPIEKLQADTNWIVSSIVARGIGAAAEVAAEEAALKEQIARETGVALP